MTQKKQKNRLTFAISNNCVDDFKINIIKNELNVYFRN